MLFLNIIYVLLAVAMIALILMQRGAGAQAGSGFGGGASGTVFGARGSANFLSKSTKWLAVAFFVLSLAISINVSRTARKPDADNGSLMAQVPAAPTQAAHRAFGRCGSACAASAPQAAPSVSPSTTVPAQPATSTPNSPPTGG